MHVLKIKINDSEYKEYLTTYYQEKVNHIGYDKDCGVDLITPTNIIANVGRITKIDLGISCEFVPANHLSGAFWLVPRSSIVNTPLQMANSIGIIDPEYRGPIVACVRCFKDNNHYTTTLPLSSGFDKHYEIVKGTRLFQIVSPDGNPIKVELVDELTTTNRGNKGFGSTG